MENFNVGHSQPSGHSAVFMPGKTLFTDPQIAHPPWLQKCQQNPVCKTIECHNSHPVSSHRILLHWSLSPFLTDLQSLNWLARSSFPSRLLDSARGDFSLCIQMSHIHPLHLRPHELNPLGPRLLPGLGISSAICLPWHAK